MKPGDLLPPGEYPAPKHWTATASGGALDLDDPRPEQIRLTDVATGLAHVCRWNGQTPLGQRISVAEHSVLVARLAIASLAALPTDDPRPVVQACLLHDAHEAYPPGDVAGPVKAYLRARGDHVLAELEAAVQRAIELRFGVVYSAAVAAAVKQHDLESRWLERAQLLLPCERGWGEGLPRPRDPHPRIECWEPERAAETWLEWCHDWGIR
ncbi:MAG: hypothetical protein IPH07_24480 [Deltaproteobacteria bacterium]|nr:hypothetical protein [Deltaproteobacteria bacterium]